MEYNIGKEWKWMDEGYNTNPNLQMYIDKDEWEEEMGRNK